jgi:hypothetical protein
MSMGGVNDAASHSERSTATEESGFNLLAHVCECEVSYRMPLAQFGNLLTAPPHSNVTGLKKSEAKG